MESVKQNLPNEEEVRLEAMKIYNELLKEPEISEALNLLDSLPKNLKYHNKDHTLDVLRETILFAVADGLDEEAIKLQAIAAAWHDVGYVQRYENNEPVAVELFKGSQAFKTLSEEQRDEVVAIILDTQMVMKDGRPFLLQQRSHSGYVLDGDVSNFGRQDYLEKRMDVAQELNLDLSNSEVKKKFFAFALELLKNHQWKTKSAQVFRKKQKDNNLALLEEEYAKL